MIDKLFSAKLDDAVKLAVKGPKFIGFLDPAHIEESKEYLKYNNNSSVIYYGGYENAERQVLGSFPFYMEPEYEDFPITPITITYKKEYKLSHGDFLGTFMAQGIVRGSIGDILIEEGRCVVFVRSELADYFTGNISKIGGVGVTVSCGFSEPLPIAHNFSEKNGVVASERLDCVTAFLTGSSREKAVKLIKSALVTVNYKEISSNSVMLKEGDTVAVRSFGKFIIDSLGPVTKKGRLSIKCRKYK